MDENLKELVSSATNDGNSDAVAKIIEKFEPSIKKYANILDYYGAESDLIIGLIESIYKLKPERIASFEEAQVISYIAKIIRNKSIDLNRAYIKKPEEILLNEYAEVKCDNIELEATAKSLLELLNEKQRFVIIMRYYYGYSDKEIGIMLGISRQAVNKIHRKALEIMRA